MPRYTAIRMRALLALYGLRQSLSSPPQPEQDEVDPVVGFLRNRDENKGKGPIIAGVHVQGQWVAPTPEPYEAE